MVQHNYIHRLALGRSAFESPIQREHAPDETSQDEAAEDARYSQRYDERGHPVNLRSRTAARRLRRAQNDVLSTIGITLPTGTGRHESKSRVSAAAAEDQHDLEDREGWSLLGISFLFESLISASTTAVHNQRVRLQTFSEYVETPVTHAMLVESGQQSYVSYFLAGEPEFWASHLADAAFKVLSLAVSNGVERLWIALLGEDALIQQRNEVLTRIEQGLSLGTSIAMCPFYAIVTLQRLQLLPAVPLFIWPWQYSLGQPFLALLPPVPSAWSLATASVFLGQLPFSPIGMYLFTEVIISKLRDVLTRYSRAGLPRPDNPERRAILAAEAGSGDRWDLLDYPLLQPTLKDELAIDLRWIGKQAGFYWYKLRNLFVPAATKTHRERMLSTLRITAETTTTQSRTVRDEGLRLLQDVQTMGDVLMSGDEAQLERRLRNIEQSLAALSDRTRELSQHEDVQEDIRRANALINAVREDFRNVGMDAEQQPAPARHNSLQEPTIIGDATDSTSQETIINEAEQESVSSVHSHPSASRPTPSLPNSSPSASPPLAPTNVQVRTRSGSTSTLHMDVEINQAAVDGSTYTTSFSASPRSAAVETSISQVIAENSIDDRPHHRVTEFSLLPTDLLSQVLLRVVIQGLILPLQSYQCRSIARNFLAMTDPGRVDEVFLPTSWFGLGLRHGTSNAFSYAGKLAFCLGAEMCLGMGSWLLVSCVSSVTGRRWFSWGKL